MPEDGLPHLRSSLKRQPALRIAQYPPQRDGEAAASQRHSETTPFSLWRASLIAVLVIVTLVSTSLLAYLLLYGERTAPQGQLQQVEQRQPQQQAPSQPAPGQFAQSEQQPPAQQANPEPEEWAGPPPPVPNDAILLTLIRSSLTALWQANQTGNYSVLRDMGSNNFKDANSVEKLAQAFAPLRDRNFDISAILLVQPKLYRKAEIGPKGNLRISGFFTTRPELTNFNLMFHPLRNGRWQLLSITVNYEAWPQPTAKAASQGAPKPAAEGNTEQETPADSTETVTPEVNPQAPSPTPQRKLKKPAEANKTTSEPQADIRDRIDNPPAPEEKPKEKSFWNPFSR